MPAELLCRLYENKNIVFLWIYLFVNRTVLTLDPNKQGIETYYQSLKDSGFFEDDEEVEYGKEMIFHTTDKCHKKNHLLFYSSITWISRKIKINRIHKTVLVKSCFGMPFEFVDIHIQPDWFAEIKFIADHIQSIENLVGSCIVAVITDGGVFDHTVVFNSFPHKRNMAKSSL